MTTTALAAWVYAALLWQVPPEQAAARPTFPEAQETAEERTARYLEIAGDIALVVADEPELERRRAAALLVAIAVRESALAKDVDSPRCGDTRIRRGGCDHGRAVSLWQLQGVRPATRLEAGRLALAAARRSQRACRGLPARDGLAAYAAGRCLSAEGRRLSRDRFALAARIEAYRP